MDQQASAFSYGKPERLAALPPFEGGGEMIDVVERERVTYNEPPHRFEAGTPPILEAIGSEGGDRLVQRSGPWLPSKRTKRRSGIAPWMRCAG